VPETPDANRIDPCVYRLAFIRNCHRWLAAGYSELDGRAFSTSEETVITGELVRAMKLVRLRTDAPNWMIRMYVADDPPINCSGRLGRRRRRVDIEFERSSRGLCFHFQYEAKRLCRSDSLRQYLGKDGLGMFLSGDYASQEDEAGMLGYVQSENVDIWRQRITAELESRRQLYRMYLEGGVVRSELLLELPQVHESVHSRSSSATIIRIYHTLLAFSIAEPAVRQAVAPQNDG